MDTLIPLLVFMVIGPAALVVALRRTRAFWLPGAVLLVAGLYAVAAAPAEVPEEGRFLANLDRDVAHAFAAYALIFGSILLVAGILGHHRYRRQLAAAARPPGPRDRRSRRPRSCPGPS